jgi:hypothetical protein
VLLAFCSFANKNGGLASRLGNKNRQARRFSIERAEEIARLESR